MREQARREPSSASVRKSSAAKPVVTPKETQPGASISRPIQRKGKMPENVQTQMESALGSDFSDVNIHVGSKAPEVGALAYAQGNDIHFAPGQYNPDSAAGQQLLGHELTHVVQQRQGRVKPTMDIGGMPVNDDPSLEKEADRMGAKAAQTKLDPGRYAESFKG
jgi:hypothetical protein